MNEVARVYRGHLPADPDVTRLMDAYQDIAPGQEIPYAEIAKLIGVSRPSPRFERVTKKWRRLLFREKNWTIACSGGRAFVRLEEMDRAHHAASKWLGGARTQYRATDVMQRVVTAGMSERDRNTVDHMTRRMVAHADETRRAFREIAPPQPQKALPKVRLVGGDK